MLAINPDLNTTKEDTSLHGIGTNSIKSIVENSNGILKTLKNMTIQILMMTIMNQLYALIISPVLLFTVITIKITVEKIFLCL